MQCCGSQTQAITVQAGANGLTLLRCTRCTQQRWARGGLLLERHQALLELTNAFGSTPRSSQARTSAASVKRQEERRLHRMTAQETAAAEQPPGEPNFTSLLNGWQVLGATA